MEVSYKGKTKVKLLCGLTYVGIIGRLSDFEEITCMGHDNKDNLQQ